jgi:hypothetical protein
MLRLTRIEIQDILGGMDRSTAFRDDLTSRYPKEVSALVTFRRRMGDKCPYVKNIVKRIAWMETERVGPGWLQDVRARTSA